MYIRSNTRKNNSARSSQGGIRCGACLGPDAGPCMDSGVEAGFGAKENDESSGR
jgi:hypothetical protein